MVTETLSPVERGSEDSPLAAIAAWAVRRPAAPALTSVGGPAWSFLDLERRRRSWAGLARAAAGPSSRPSAPVVAVCVPPGPEYVAALLAAASVGAALPCGPDERREELERAFTEAGVGVALTSSSGTGEAAAAARACGAAVVVLEGAGPSTPGPPPLPAPSAVCYVLRTSGTTGRPRLVSVPHAVAAARTHNLARALALGAEDVCLVVTPLQHSTGLGTALAALVAGGCACCAPRFDPARLFAWLRVSGATWLAMSPAMLSAAVEASREPGFDATGHRLRFVRSGNAPLDRDGACAAEACFGVPVLQAYGTTETGLVTCEPLPPAPRKPGSSGVSAGPRVAVLDHAGGFAPTGVEGDLAVAGPTIPAARLAQPDVVTAAGGPWLPTGDRGRMDADGHLFVTGRTSEFVNVGGRKVAPLEVEALLRQHPAVADVAVFGVPDERLGERVAAVVVPRRTVPARVLRRWLLPRLSPYKIPGLLEMVEAVPRDALGKVSRASLSASHAGRSSGLEPLPGSDEGPEGEPGTLLAYLAGVWREVLKLPRVSPDDDFLSLGGDSLWALRVTERVSKGLGLEVPLRWLFDAPRLADYARRIEARAGLRPADRTDGATAASEASAFATEP